MVRVLLVLLLLIIVLWLTLQTEWGQNLVARQITKKFSRELQTKISIKRVSFNLFNFNKMDLEGVLVEDQKQDTLLYAGTFQVRITDWFFFKDKAELKYIGLEDAVIYMNRTDSVWNYTFLQKYFTSTDTSTKKSSGIEFDLKKVVMKNVSFHKKDAWLGSDLLFRVKGLDMDADKITLTQKTVDVTNLLLDQPYVYILDYDGRAPESTESPASTTASKSTPLPWDIRFGNVKITNGRFRNDKGTDTPLAGFDGKHLDFSKINGSLENIGWARDTITGNINLSMAERSGLVVKSMKAKTTIHPKAMIFDELYLETNRSIIRDHYSMHYNKISDMSDYLHKVTMHANFNKSTISSDDIAFFAPSLSTWKKNIRIDGLVKGTVDALASEDLELWAGNNTYVHGAVSLIGLPDINQTLINVDAQELRTTYRDAVNFIPAIGRITTPDLKKISFLNFKGTYTGFITDFVSYGTIQTNLGTLVTDLNMKFPRNGEPVYVGKLSTGGFQLGSFINSPKLGVVAFNGTVKGTSFDWKKLDMKIDGVVHRIQYDNYTYQNITVKGNLARRLFAGDFVIRDPNADLQLHGTVDLTGRKPLFNVTADIRNANLKALQLTTQDIQLRGLFDLNLEASTLSDMLGSARIRNATLVSNGKEISFDSLVVSSTYVDGLKRLRAVSNEFDATVNGDFDLAGLPDAFTLFLSRYYPAYIRPPRYVKPQVFTFDIKTGVVEDYIKLVDSRLTGFNNSHITGSLNTSANTMTIDADVPYFGFQQYRFSDVQLKGSGDLQRLSVTGQTTNAQIGDSLFFPQTTFSVTAQNDVSDIVISTSSNQAINQANLSAQVKTYTDGASINFNPSTFVINGKTWNIEQGGELNFRKNTVVNGEVVLRESNQLIRIWTELDDVGGWNNLKVAFENINMGDISPFISKKNKFEGLVSGEATIEDPEKRFDVSGKIRASELRIDNDSVGRFDADFTYDKATGMFTAKGHNVDPDHRVNLDIAMDFNDSLNTFRDRINANFTNFEMKYLNRFLGTIFSDINGYISGNLDILGEGTDRDFIAKAKIRDASFKVNFTQVKYWINDTDFEMKKDFINLNNIRIRDQAGNTALVTGNIRHQGFQNMYYELKVETESDRMEILNTTYNDNQQFFGKARGAGSFVMVGPQSDMLMDINVKASERDTSYITLPPSKSKASGQASFMVERKYGREMTPQSVGAATNLTYTVRLQANPLVNVEVQLDDLTGDAITGRGTGNLLMTSGTNAPLSLIGRYNIEEGEYVFTFQSVLGKKFTLKPGSNNFIEWSGDPYEATVNLDAIYTAKNVSFAPLASTLFVSSSGLQTARDDVNVQATLTGDLFKPNFTFRLDFPNNKPIYNTPDFQFALQQMEKNQNELNKQVTYLIVFNTFAPFESTSGDYNPFGEFTYNTISGLLFGEVNRQLNKILAGILPNNNFTLNFTGSLYNRNLIDQNKVFRLPTTGNLNINLGVPLFNDRVNIQFGGTLDVPLTGDIQQSVRIYPDITIEFIINKSGSLRANIFYRQNVDFIAGNTTGGVVPKRYGASIGYGKEFDTLGELFGKRKKRPLKDTVPVIDSTGTN